MYCKTKRDASPEVSRRRYVICYGAGLKALGLGFRV